MSLDKVSVIFSTYNSPDWLEKVIWGYSKQTFSQFEIIIADDGSKPETEERINRLREESGLDIKHVWQEDDGFQKCAILNKAIEKSTTEYLIFSDGDCIPRADFIETHVKFAEKGKILSGGYFLLPMDTSVAITKNDILNQKCFETKWLVNNGLKSSIKTLKLRAGKMSAWLLNRLTQTRPSWNGHNSSAWKDEILSVNGFDERLRYGGEDRELGERLFNKGITGKQIRYSAIVVHLDHSRGYIDDERRIFNRKIRKNTRENCVVWTDFGIKKS